MIIKKPLVSILLVQRYPICFKCNEFNNKITLKEIVDLKKTKRTDPFAQKQGC